MVLVSEFPAEARGAVGVVTLEDVIEELIGEEIIDESDVFIDVHKAIRRMAPAPRARVPRGKVIIDQVQKRSEAALVSPEHGAEENNIKAAATRKASSPEMNEALLKPAFMLRRRSSGSNGTMEPLRSDDPQVMQHLRHLGPSNAANRPKQTRINTVKIKPGQAPDIPNTIPEHSQLAPETILTQEHAPQGGIGEGLLASAGRDASDGVHSLAVGYGTMAPSGDRMSWKSGRSARREADDEHTSPKDGSIVSAEPVHCSPSRRPFAHRPRSRSVSTVASLRSTKSRSRSPPTKRHTARSGSISENVVDVNGIKKIVLETTSSSDSEGKATSSRADSGEDARNQPSEADLSNFGGASKKKRKKRGKKKKGGKDDGESQSLLGNH